MGLWFAYLLVVGIFAAYIGVHSLKAGDGYLGVFRIIGTLSFAAYGLALPQAHIWYHRDLGTTTRSMIDGLLYACLTAGTFGWLWPK